MGAGSKDMGCARCCDPGERRQMEAVESLIGDGVRPGRWLEQQGASTEEGTRVVVFPAGELCGPVQRTICSGQTGTREGVKVRDEEKRV